MNWISTDEYLPQAGELVLCWKRPISCCQSYALGYWFTHSSGKVKWCLDGSSGLGVDPPLYWQRLPEGPRAAE